MHRVSVGPPGRRLVGHYAPAAGPAAVVWAHGFGSHRGGDKSAAVRAECGRRGWAFAAFDFHAHGESDGAMPDLRASRLVDDLARVRDFLAAAGHPRVGLVGSSMGGLAAAWFARTFPGHVIGVVLVAPAFRFLHRRWDRLTPAERADWERTGVRREVGPWVDAELGFGLAAERGRFDPQALAAGWATPALVFHGWADDVVPPADSLAFLAAAADPRVEVRLLKAGDHRLTAFKDEIAAEAGRFFAPLGGG